MSWHPIGAMIQTIASSMRDSARLSSQPVRGPWPGRVRTAVLEPWFRVTGNAKIFDTTLLSAINNYKPRALAGPIPVLRRLAETVLITRGVLPTLDHGVLAFTGIGRTPLKECDRDLLWRAFQVPVYVQFRSWSGQMLAAECEAHEGLHIETAEARFEIRNDGSNELLVMDLNHGGRPAHPPLPVGMKGRVTNELCACGRKGPRLVDLRATETAPVRAFAAGA